MSTFAFGYGCYMDSVIYHLGYGKRLIDALPEKIRKEFDEEWKEEMGEEIYSSPEEYMEECFASDYDGDGVESLLADILNVKYFEEKPVIRGEEGVLYSLPLFPKSKEERAEMPLLEDISKAISEAIGIIAVNADKIELGYYYFEEL